MKYSPAPSFLILLALPALAVAVGVALGAEPTEVPQPGPLEFRRVYAPANQWQDWPRDHLRYVPMKPEEFERLVHAAEASKAELPSATAALTSAQYRASLDPNGVLRGEALFTVQVTDKQVGLLALDPCGLAITQATWQGKDAPPAELGLGAEGILTVRARQSGTLRLDWSLRGQADSAGAWQFDLALPRCPSSELLLDLPANLQPAATPAVALSETTEAGRRHWRIELGGHHRLPLRLLPSGDAEPGPRLALVRQVLAYDLSLHGLDLSAELQLDVHHEPLRELVVRLDPRLKLVKAQCGEAAIPWSLLTPAADGQGARILLPLPEPLQGTSRVLRLGAVAPLELDRRWRLPTIHSEGLFWQEGSATIGIRAPLSLKQLVPSNCRQSKTGALSGPRPGESVDLQYFADDAGVDVILERSRAQLQVASGTSVQLSREEMRAQVVAELSTTEGEIFQWEAEIERQWRIDAVEAQPAEALGEGWEDDGNGKLLIHLHKPVAPTRPVRLLITARRLQSALGQPLGLEDLTPLQVAEVASRRNLLAVHAVEPYRLKLNGMEHLRQIEPGKLNAAERSLFVEPPRDLVFENNGGAAGLQISLVSPKPSYTATIRIDATALRSEAIGTESYWLRESYAVHCLPNAARVDRVLIHFCIPRPAPPQWSWGPGGEGPIEARRLSAAEQASALMDTRGETWELAFRQAKGVPFEIRASRLVEWKEETPVSLACAPEATQQHGILVVGSSPGTTIRIDNERLEPMPLDEISADLLTTARAKFRFSPMSDAVHADQAVVTIYRQDPVLPAAWIWSSQLESRYQVDGTGRHTLRYCLENSGQPRLEVTLPPRCGLDKVASVWTEGQPATWQILGDTRARRLAIDLPSDRRYPVVCLQFQTEGEPLETGSSLTPPLPTMEIPILAQHWTVWLPPGYETHWPGLWRQAGDASASRGAGRTVRLLERDSGAAPFDPASLGDWRRLVGDAGQRRAMRAATFRFLERLGDVEQNARKAAEPANGRATSSQLLNWSTLLGQAREGLELSVLVDPAALAGLRLDPRTPVVTPRSDARGDRGMALLAQAELALLLFPQGVVLTSAQEAASLQSALVPLRGETLWEVQSGPLAEHLRQAVEEGNDPTFVPLDQWPQRLPGPVSPWSLASPGDSALDTLGWTVRRLEIPPGPPVTLSVVFWDALRAYQVMVFLSVFALLAWIARESPALSLVSFGLSALAASFLSEPYGLLASGAVLGSAMALVLYLIRRKAPQPQAAELSETAVRESLPPAAAEPSHLSGTARLLLALGLSLTVASARAEEASNTPSVGPRQVHNVLIPVDEKQHPTGANYFVPEGLYQQLQQYAVGTSAQPQGWLLRSALYRGTLTRQSAAEQFALSDLKAIFELEVFQPSTRIRLPFGREGINLLPEGARLDGRVLQLEWQEKEAALVFDVREPGPYRLELALRPNLQGFGNSSGMEMRIPRLPMSRLELNLPPDAPAVKVPSALGAVTVEQVPPRLVAELGNSDRLAIRWPETPGSTHIGPALDVEALYWLKVHPGSVVLSARWKVKVVEGMVRQLRLTTDPRLRLLPLRDSAAAIGQVQTTTGDPQIFQFDLARPAIDQVNVELDFLLAGTTGIGSLRLPQIEISDARVTKRWLAVSVDRALVFEEQAPGRLEALAVPAFEAAWGKSEGPPNLAYNLPAGPLTWSLATHPDAPRITADQVTTVCFTPGSARVEFNAQLVTSGYSFQYHLSAPKQLLVERVLVRSESAERAARWSRDAEGGITVFLSESASGPQQLTVSGKMNTPLRGPAMLPLLRVDGTEMRSSEVQIFRDPAVLVDVADVKGLREADLPVLAEEKEPLGRLVKRLMVADGSPGVGATVTLAPNQPELAAEQLTRVRGDGKSWELEVQFTVKVSRGVADEFRLQVPPSWNGPYQLDPPAPFRIVNDAGSRRRELILRPRQAVDREYRFHISGPLTVLPGQRVSVPTVRLLDADRSKSLLVVPTQLSNQRISWQTHGLKEVTPPADLDSATSPEGLTAYELENASFQAVLNPVDHSHHTANVVLADLHFTWQADGSYEGLALFDLEPAGQATCPLHLPADARLLSVRVEGVPATPQSAGLDRWEIPLESINIPQRIEVLVAGQLADPVAAGSCRFEAPSLGNLPVRQTLWSVSGPAEYPARPARDVDVTDPLRMDLIRLQAIVSITDLIHGLNLSGSDEWEKTASWQAIWRHRWENCRQQIRQEVNDNRLRRPAGLTAELETLDRRYKELALRLDPSIGAGVTAFSSLDPQLWPERTSSEQTLLRCLTPPGMPALVLHVQAAQNQQLVRLLGVLGCLLLVCLASVGKLRRFLTQFCCRWPAAVGVLVGLGWWLWLEPSVVGLLLILLTFLVGSLSLWQRPRGSRTATLSRTPRL